MLLVKIAITEKTLLFPFLPLGHAQRLDNVSECVCGPSGPWMRWN